MRSEIDAALGTGVAGTYEPYGLPMDVEGAYSQPFRFTGEMRDQNTIQYSRSRHYIPAVAVWSTQDLFEGNISIPLSLNLYSWVEGNSINFVDPLGFFACASESGEIVTACSDFDSALSRATLSGLSIPINPKAIDEAGRVDLKNLVSQLKQLFGVQFQAPGRVAGTGNLDLIDLDDCTLTLINGELDGSSYEMIAKSDVLRTGAALIHIVSRLQQANITNPISKLRNIVGDNRLNYFGQLLVPNKVIEGSGLVPSDPTTDRNIFLGSNVSTATIVHEFGHAIDRAFNYKASQILSITPLRYSGAEKRFLLSDDTVIPPDTLPLVYDGGLLGIASRASEELLSGEIWADVFMTWAMAGTQAPTKFLSPESPNWDCSTPNRSGFANMWYYFASGLMYQLIQNGGLFGDDVQFLRGVEGAIRLSQYKVCP